MSNAQLLRVYWYDGALGARPTLEQAKLALMDHIKLRLGLISGSGTQKGVDSLIVTDLIDLARNHAITDAVILSGDEDIRIGVQIAQTFGVRVHLIGIIPSRGSQSVNLLRESDTTTEWDVPTISRFLSVKAAAMTPPPAVSVTPFTGAASSSTKEIDASTAASIDAIVAALTGTLDTTAVNALKSYWRTSRGIPQEFDGKLLAQSRTALCRQLDVHERRYVRAKFTATIQAM
jgi:NYN domain